METSLSVLLILGSLHQTAESTVSLFSQTGGSVTLEFQQRQPLQRESIVSIQWCCGSEKIMLYVPHRDAVTVFTHKDRVVFNKQTFSLELKNLQKNDSGLYKGVINAGQKDIEAQHKLSILDPVQAPVLSVVSNSSSSDPCNVTVTCRGQQPPSLSLTSSCSSKSHTCTPKGKAFEDSALTLSVRDGRIICNHSNLVSWRNEYMGINQSCQIKDNLGLNISGDTVGIPLGCGCVLLLCCGAGVVVYWKRKRTETAVPQTLYAEVPAPPQTGPAVENPYEEISSRTRDDNKTLNPTKDSCFNAEDFAQGATLPSGQSVTSVYSTLQPS